jgi:hypothetical protein
MLRPTLYYHWFPELYLKRIVSAFHQEETYSTSRSLTCRRRIRRDDNELAVAVDEIIDSPS